MEEKRCIKCGEVKAIKKFDKRKTGSYRDEICKTCRYKKYKDAHPDKIRERDKKYRDSHRDKIIQCQKRYYILHRNELRKKVKQWQTSHPECNRKVRNKLRKNYIVTLLRAQGLNIGINNEIIDLKREQLQFHRLARGVKRRIKDELHNRQV